jgi:CSLREA domain-containing protein
MSGRIPPRRLAPVLVSALLLLSLAGLSLGLLPAATPASASAPRAARAPRARAAGATLSLFATTYTVNSTGDGDDTATDDGVCDDGTGHCTLRAAIEQSNATPGTDTIAFQIPGAGLHTISPASALPTLTDPVIIDGYTQPGSSPNTLTGGDDAVIEIELDGTNAGTTTSGLVVTGGGSTIRGLAINRFGTGGMTSVTAGGTGVELNSDGNTVEGCFVGTDPTGTLPLPNINDGVGVTGNANTVGGSTPAARNVLSGNDREGLLLLSTSSANNVFGNYIGTDLNGAAALSNGAGVVIFGLSNNNRVGGVNAGEGNLISGNLDSGVIIVNTTHDNLVRGNLIGTNAGGAIPLANQNDGVQIFDTASNNKIGGTSAAAANVISGNMRDGVRVGSTGAGNVVSRNFIGVAGNGSDSSANGEDGVRVDGGANLTVGGSTTSSSNIIAFNTGRGVNLINGATGVNVGVNSIRNNGTLGIDLAGNGVTPNDAGDADTGENGLQNFPVITSAAEFGQNVSVAGTLNSAANSVFTLRFFANTTCDPSGNGQGASFVGSGTVRTDGAGNASFSFYFENVTPAGNQITATATDSAGDTSEFSACFTAAAVTACGAGSFSAATTFPVSGSPVAVAVGDFNGDGKRDLALAGQVSGTLSVLLGDGAGGFGAATSFAVGAGPQSVAVADFNGDGHQDIATANRNSNNVSILLGDGTGGFSAATNFNAGTSPDGIVAADFNGDGKLDLAVSNGGTDNVSILLGNGAGNFGAATNFALSDSPNAIAVGDFNNDGNPDVVTVNFFTNTASVLLGDGAGGLGTAQNFTVGTLPLSVAVGDFNGDGNADIVTANRGSDNVSVLIGDGTGGFSAANNVATGSGPASVAVGDINGDGKEDIVTANLAAGTASVLPGDGAGNFGAPQSFTAGNAPQSVAASDFNGDGKPDLAVANNTSNNVAVLASNCTPPGSATFVVNSAGDGADNNPGDGACDDGTGHCTLRAAIMESNANAGTDSIAFNIPGAGVHTISPASALPAITDAVTIDGYTQPGASKNTQATGDNAVIEIELDGTNAGASTSGLVISAGGSTVRGLAVNRFGAAGNTHGDAVEITTNGNTVEGCFLGTNPSGTAAAANANHGLLISNASNNLVGGASPAARNLISGNSQDGIFVADTGGGATGNVIKGNFIGTDATGNSSLGNGASGVAFTAANNNSVGGTGAGAPNTVAFNGHGGIVVKSGTGDAALSNSVHDNAGLGIDLGDDGVTANDAGDADTGANNLQNFPLLNAADTSGASTKIQGTLDSAASATFRVEFFSSPACDASGNGEGRTLLGSSNVTTDASGKASISATFAVALSPSDRVTATATSAGGDTSEFSPCLAPTVTANWTGAVSTDWHTAGNWDTNAVPTAANLVVIPSAGVTNEPTISAADAAAASVTVQSGRTLSINSGRTLTASTIAVNSGGALNVGASQTGIVNAALTVDGTLTGGAGATLVFDGASLTNNGTISVPVLQFGGASQTLSGDGVFTSASVVLLPGASVALASDEQLGPLSVQGGATFDQGASFNLTLGGLVVNSGGLFKNLGTGGLTLAGDVSNSGTVQLNGGGAACGDADSILIRSSADGTQRAWSGAGTFSLADVDVRDQAGTATVVVLSGTSSGDNGPNWKFETCGGIIQTFSVSGRVADAANQPLVGINVHLGGSLTADTTTDGEGGYIFPNLTQGGSYDLTPTEVNFRFAPPASAVSNLQADQAGVNFNGTFLDHTITGHVVDAQNNPLPGVTVTLAGSFSAVAHTDAQGSFTFTDVPENGSFVVTPEREGFTFDPAHQSVTSVSADVQFQAVGTIQPSPTPTPDQSDDFSGGPDPNPDKWVRGILTNPPADFDPLVNVFLGGGLLHVQPRPDANGPSYSGLISVRALDLNSTPVVSVEVVQAARGEGTQTIFGLGRDSDNWFRFSVAQNTPTPTPTPTPTSTPTPTPTASPAPTPTASPTPNASPTPTTSPTPSGPSSSKAGARADTSGQTLFFEFSVGGNKFSTGIDYNPAQQRFWRFRHDAPAHLLIFETSPDAANWTERFRATLPPDQTALIAELSAGTFLPTHTPGEALFDNFLISPSPQLQFANPTFSASESAGSAQVQVIRTGSAESPDAVDFATSDGTARAGRDYTATSGTLVFAVGERLKTVSVPLINNDARDGDRTFNVTLSNPVGGRLGSITRAAVNILDDDTPANRLDDTTFFVTQHYLDFLGRQPDADGLRFWVNNIDSCGADSQCREVKRIDTSAAFFLSIEFQETGYVVERFYVASFGRPPKFAEYLPDLSALREGVIIGQPGAEDRLALNKELFAEQWVARPEFKQAFGGLNEEQYVDALAANAGVHLAEEDRTAFIVGLLTDRETRAGVLLQIVENSDFKQRDFNAAFVRMQYFGYLRRDPDAAGFQFWLAKLNQFGGDFRRAEMVKAFLSSSEYRSRFGQP